MNISMQDCLIQDKSNRHIQKQLYMFLERPSGMRCFVYNISLLLITIFSIVFNSIVSIPDFEFRTMPYIVLVDFLLFTIFLVEYTCRVWSVGCRQEYRGLRGRTRFILKPLCILDAMAIVGLGICLQFKFVFASYPPHNFIIIRCMRFLQFARLFHFDRYVTSWRILYSVFQGHLQELITTVYFAFVFLVIVSYMLWLAERRNRNPAFSSLADSFYCTLITMTTIGYGDKVPGTFLGRAIVSTVGIFGVFLWALPAGIIGSGFALKIREERKKRKYIRLQPSAARLIQTWWRLILLKGGCNRRTLSERNCRQTDSGGKGDCAQVNGNKDAEIKSFPPTASMDPRVCGAEGSSGLVSSSLAQLSYQSLLSLRYIMLLRYFAAKSKFMAMSRTHRNALSNHYGSSSYIISENSRNQWRLTQLTIEGNAKLELFIKEQRQMMSSCAAHYTSITKRLDDLERLLAELKATSNAEVV